ncbi:MAG: hypothetical protein LJE62_15200 [Silicimonas sp.]|jgi:hypothetical protein|nr:hypothetical protein [Silicimonas sp.]
MNGHTCQILGLIGFIVAGILFVAIGIRDGDWLVIAASIVWNVSCLVWLIPHFRKGNE